MAITAGNLLAKVSKILNDETGTRWPVNTEMLGVLDTVQREAVRLKPELLTVSTPMQLASGPEQSLTAGEELLLDVRRNMGLDGSSPGRVITQIERQTLDVLRPDWNGAPASPIVRHFMYDIRTPKVFHVYPPQPTSGQGYIEVVRSVAPTPITDAKDAISLDDTYEGALIAGCLWWALSKNATVQNAQALSLKYREIFMEGIGLRGQTEMAVAPGQQQTTQVA